MQKIPWMDLSMKMAPSITFIANFSITASRVRTVDISHLQDQQDDHYDHIYIISRCLSLGVLRNSTRNSYCGLEYAWLMRLRPALLHSVYKSDSCVQYNFRISNSIEDFIHLFCKEVSLVQWNIKGVLWDTYKRMFLSILFGMNWGLHLCFSSPYHLHPL